VLGTRAGRQANRGDGNLVVPTWTVQEWDELLTSLSPGARLTVLVVTHCLARRQNGLVARLTV
jgi:hypothetical protein